MICNYSGIPLDDSTTDEHIIPKKLGGRITSNKIMSSSVNNLFSKIDDALVARYRMVLHNLSDFIPSFARPANIPIDINRIEGGQFSLTTEGPILRQSKGKKVKIDGKDVFLLNPGSTVPAHYSNKPQAFKHILYKDLTDQHGDCFSLWNTRISTKVDLAVLKIACSSVFHICNTFPEFGMRKHCFPLARAIFDLTTDINSHPELIRNHLLGFQIDSARIITSIEHSFKTVSPFSHYVAIFYDPCIRTLDAAVVLFGNEVFGVRICKGVSYSPSYIIQNPIFLDTSASIRQFDPNENFAIKTSPGRSRIPTDTEPIEFEISKKAIHESMDDLLAKSEFYKECYSINNFRSAIDQWIKHLTENQSLEPECLPTLGHICQHRISIYFKAFCDQIPLEHTNKFTEFNKMNISDTVISDDLLSELFQIHQSTIISLSAIFGIPRMLQARESEYDMSLIKP